MTRRDFLRVGVRAVALLPAVSLLDLAACAPDAPGPTAPTSSPAVLTGTTREVRLLAAPGEVELGPLGVYRTWLYNGQYPGPEIRAAEGDRLRITVENRLPEATTIHWHGIPVPNAMDGVPGLTQAPVAPGGSFLYDFVAAPAGSYLYHSHVGLQLDRALVAPLVITESAPHVAYDREYTLVLDDFLRGAPTLSSGGGGMMGGGMMGGGMMGGGPAYEALLINGRPPSAPRVFEVGRGQRVRLRLMNPAGATAFRVAVAGHRMQVTHSDGRPVRPVEVDSLLVGMGERYDVVVTADNPGVWTIAAAGQGSRLPFARAVLRYTGTTGSPSPGEVPAGLSGGRQLTLADLVSVEDLPLPGTPNRSFDLTLSGGMMGSAWTINGQAWPNADPLRIRAGETVRVRLFNRSMALHPMHLHGHFFRVGQAWKDTVSVGSMGRVTFDFKADNPGRWFFHCHHLYHMELGMAREFRYV